MSESRRGQIRGRVYNKTNYRIRQVILNYVYNQTLSRQQHQVELSTRWHVRDQIREEAEQQR